MQLALLGSVLLGACARPSRPPAGLDLAACVPPGTGAAAYADLDRLRATALYAKLPVPEPLRQASGVLAILRASDWAIAARGPFRQLPAGATMIAPQIAGVGPPDLLQAMAAQYRTHAVPDLPALAPTDVPVWLVARGTATLPITGNWSNLNRLLHQTETLSIALHVAGNLEVTADAVCRTPAQAAHLEENLRAMGSMLRLRSFAVTGAGNSVRATATVAIDSLPQPGQ